MSRITQKLLLFVLIMGLFVGSCSPPPPTVTMTVPAPSTTPSPSSTPEPDPTIVQQNDDVWNRITQNKKMVVGTSWHTPPFAYENSNAQVVGLDIAIIQEVSKRLKISVEFQDIPFEELPAALQKNQVDLAISALPINQDLNKLVTFSPIYYVDQTAILARKDSPISITEFSQLTEFHIGVQRGTTFERSVKTQLVDPGLMSAARLSSYAQVDEAIRDMLANKLDLVIVGQATANYFKDQLGIQVVGNDLKQQDLALAMRLETPRLKMEIDNIITGMLTDGTMLQLIQAYTQNGAPGSFPTQIQPTLPTNTPFPIICVDNVKLVTDVTFADNDMKSPPYVSPEKEFIKTWRVQNTGTCTWNPHYRLVYVSGNVEAAQMAGQPVNITGSILPGQIIDLSVTLIAPLKLSKYQGFWQMENNNGLRFGPKIWVGISTQPDIPVGPTSTTEPIINTSCKVTLISPKTALKVRSAFDAVWTVENISGTDWTPPTVDYKFVSGTGMHDHSFYNLTQTIKNGKSGKIIVDMLAPSKPGIYTTKWAVISSKKTLCNLVLTLTVLPK
jgi:ABC-type amino acid transport substrate-binding protein